MFHWTPAVFTAKLSWAKNAICTDRFKDRNCCALLPLSPLFLPATLFVTRPGIRRVELKRKLLQLPDPTLPAVHKVKNSHSLETSSVVSLIWGEPSFCTRSKADQAFILLFLLFSFFQQSPSLFQLPHSVAVSYERTENALWLRSWEGKLTCLCTLWCSWQIMRSSCDAAASRIFKSCLCFLISPLDLNYGSCAYVNVCIVPPLGVRWHVAVFLFSFPTKKGVGGGWHCAGEGVLPPIKKKRKKKRMLPLGACISEQVEHHLFVVAQSRQDCMWWWHLSPSVSEVTAERWWPTFSLPLSL